MKMCLTKEKMLTMLERQKHLIKFTSEVKYEKKMKDVFKTNINNKKNSHAKHTEKTSGVEKNGEKIKVK